jgi:hypothetical protein
MISHVAQFFADDDEWSRNLADLNRALVPGGRLVFDTRDPRTHRGGRSGVPCHRPLCHPSCGDGQSQP